MEGGAGSEEGEGDGFPDDEQDLTGEDEEICICECPFPTVYSRPAFFIYLSVENGWMSLRVFQTFSEGVQEHHCPLCSSRLAVLIQELYTIFIFFEAYVMALPNGQREWYRDRSILHSCLTFADTRTSAHDPSVISR